MRRILSSVIALILAVGFFCIKNEATASSAPIISSKEVEHRAEDNNKRIISKSTYKISAIYPSSTISSSSAAFPGYRGPGQLVVYHSSFGATTGTNEFGKEAVVVDDTVVKLTGANSIIPNNGVVISGHGSAKKWINDNLKIGTKININEQTKTITAYTTVDSFRYSAKEKIREVDAFIDEAKKIYSNPEDKKARYYLKRAKQDYRKSLRANDNMAITYAKSSVEMSKIALNYALPYVEGELKGVWVRPVEKNQAQIRKTIEDMSAVGINTIFLETYFHGMTIFPSDTMRSYGFVTQNPLFAAYDPLDTYIKEAHKRKMKVHVWFQSFYVGNKYPTSNPNYILAVKPEWANKTRANYYSKGYVSHPAEHNGYFLDPANPEVINFLANLAKEIITKYPVDGVNLDYIRYPSAQRATTVGYEFSNWGYTDYARREFKEIYGIDPIDVKYGGDMWNNWNKYRQDKITAYTQRMRKEIKNKSIVLSAVIFPDYKTCLETKQQDWAKWSQNNYVDAITPLILTSDDELFSNMLKEIKTKTSSKTDIYPGLFIGFMEGEAEDLLKQINVARSLKSRGVILFDWAHLGNKYKDALKFCVFTSTCKLNTD